MAKEKWSCPKKNLILYIGSEEEKKWIAIRKSLKSISNAIKIAHAYAIVQYGTSMNKGRIATDSRKKNKIKKRTRAPHHYSFVCFPDYVEHFRDCWSGKSHYQVIIIPFSFLECLENCLPPFLFCFLRTQCSCHLKPILRVYIQ